ncbi:MAG: amphi-Trp domain-containing protein [Polyangiaceae bacterium]
MTDRNMTDPDARAPDETEPPVSLVPEGPARARNKIKLEQTLAREEVAAYLEAIARGLRKGQIEFRRGDETLELSPAESLEVTLKASEKAKGGKLKIELSWRDASPRSARVSS